MSINIHNGTSFNEVSKVNIVPPYSYLSAYKNVKRVWVHNGTKYVMVKGRLLEVVWEVDMSTWSGVTWGNGYASNNKSKGMTIDSSGNLINLVDYALGDSKTYSGRYPIQLINASNGSISCWTSSGSTYYPYKQWTTVSGETHYEEPVCMCRCGDYVAFITFFGMVYLYNISGGRKDSYENESWHIEGTSAYIGSGGILIDYTNNCIYFPISTGTFDYDWTHMYRMGVYNGNLYNPVIHFGYTQSNSTSYSLISFVTDRETSKLVLSLQKYDKTNSNRSYSLEVYSTSYSYSSGTTNVGVLCSITTRYEEAPIYAKGGYVYTYNGDGIKKYRISDMSLVWQVSERHWFNGGSMEVCPSGVRCEDYGDSAFIMPNGAIVYFDGTIDRPNEWFSASGITAGVFNESLGIGYAQLYYSDVSYTDGNPIYNTNGLAVNKILKLKEVKK